MKVNLFWDNSNIWIAGQGVCKTIEAGYEAAFRIHLQNLFDFALDNRHLEYGFVAGSVPPPSDDIWKRFASLGVEVHKQERGALTGVEIAVDEIIHNKMMERMLDVEPQHIVLLTGDGSGYLEGKGFIKQLERAIKHGWTIEVISWDHSCNPHLKAFAEANGTYRSLNTAYNKVTFINNHRWASH